MRATTRVLMPISVPAMQEKHHVDLDWLHDFLVLAELRNFSRAADARHVTQPAFSRRVRALENWAGTALFARTPQGAVLTPAGEVFAREAPVILRAITAVRRDMREIGNRETATLVFAATHALSFTFFPRWLRQIEQHISTGPVQLLSDSMLACEELMRDGRAQFLLCHHHVDAPTGLDGAQFQGITVGNDILRPFSAPNPEGAPLWNLDGAGPPIPTLDYSAESGLGRILAARDFAARTARLKPAFSARLAATLLGMARQGEGVAWLPQSLSAEDMQAGRLIAAGGAEWNVEVAVRLYRPAAKMTSAAESCWAIAGQLAQHADTQIA